MNNHHVFFKSLKAFTALVATAAILASCSQDDGATAIAAVYVTLSTQTDAPETRATSGNTWAGTETVRVNVNGTAHDFTVDAYGTLTSASLLWSNYTTVEAFAWYPASYSYSRDQSTGIQDADFIFADKVTGITYTNYGNAGKKLTFKHKTAKVTATLTAGTGITGLTGATVSLFGYTSATVNPVTGELTGSDNNTITPFKSGETFTALLLPRDYTNENILQVTLDGKDYYWKPASFSLEGGKAYSLAVTVEKSALTVTVTENRATAWGAGSASEVTAVRTIRDIPVAFISNGTFTMGSPTEEEDRVSEETQHSVRLTKDFYMSCYEITNAQYAAFLNANGINLSGIGPTSDGNQFYILDCTGNGRSQLGVRYINSTVKWVPASGKDNFPVVYVSWYGAKAFAEWVGGSLPTEAQWEYACRATTGTAYSYGASANGNYMWYATNSSAYTHAVGTTSGGANAWGLYDMHGNVYEWCADWYGSYSTYGGTVNDPTGPTTSSTRLHVIRGGGWSSRASYCRSAYRRSEDPSGFSSSTTDSGNPFARECGFRVVWVQP